MGILSNTGLLAVPAKNSATVLGPKDDADATLEELRLQCAVGPAPFILRPFAGFYNPYAPGCSILCNHPTNTDARDYVRKVKSSVDLKGSYCPDELLFHPNANRDKEKRTSQDILSEDMFRRYAETDSRPLTPAPTLASGKSRGSRRCLTPDEPRERTAIVLDLRRSHSQETLYYHGHSVSDVAAAPTATDSLHPPSEGGKRHWAQLPPLASPVVLSKRAVPPQQGIVKKTQIKALNIVKKGKSKPKVEDTKKVKSANDGSEDPAPVHDDASGEVRRRGKRRRKGRQGGSDRLTSAGLAAQLQQDPETQIAGILTDSQNPSSRGSNSVSDEDSLPTIPLARSTVAAKNTDSFLDDDILKFLHREVDEEAIHTEFDPKRRYVLEEALRTRPDRPPSSEMLALVKAWRTGSSSATAAWLHVPRGFTRKAVRLQLPADNAALQDLTPMMYAARFVTMDKSRQFLYLTILRKYRYSGYRMPIENIEEGLILMMGGALTPELAAQFKALMDWDHYVEDENYCEDFKLAPHKGGWKRVDGGGGDTGEYERRTVKYKTWCGLCGICERMYGRFPPRESDLPDGFELSDFTLIETKLPSLAVHPALVEIINSVRTR